MAKYNLSSSPDMDCCGGEDVIVYIPDDAMNALEGEEDDELGNLLFTISEYFFDICANCLEWGLIEDNVGYDCRVSLIHDDDARRYGKYYLYEEEGV